MHSSPAHSSNSFAAPAAEFQQSTQVATIVYQGVTIAAMLLLLCTMWVF